MLSRMADASYKCEFGTFNQANSKYVLTQPVTIKMRDRLGGRREFEVDNSIKIVSIKEGDIRNHFRIRDRISQIR